MPPNLDRRYSLDINYVAIGDVIMLKFSDLIKRFNSLLVMAMVTKYGYEKTGLARDTN